MQQIFTEHLLCPDTLLAIEAGAGDKTEKCPCPPRVHCLVQLGNMEREFKYLTQG